MARKLDAADPVGKPRQSKSAADKAADEAQALDPTATLHIGGEEITVREYGFFEKSRVAQKGRGFIADLQALVGDGEVEDVFDEVRLLFGPHEDFVKYAIAVSIDKPVEWVAALSSDEIEPLAYLWFGTAGRFFFNEVALRVRGRFLKAQLDGSTSSSSSAGTSTASADTPNDN